MLKLSSSTTLSLECTAEYVATFNEHILPALSTHFNGSTPMEFRSFKIILNHNSRVIDLVASTSLPTSPIPHVNDFQADIDIDAEFTLSLSFLGFHDFNDVVDMTLRRACEVLSFSKLEFLSIFSLVTTRPVNWGEVFRHCTEVTTVQVAGHGMASLLEFLAPPQRYSGKGRKRRRGDNGGGTAKQASHDNNNNNNNSESSPMWVPIFPKLTSLLLERLDFNIEVLGLDIVFDVILRIVRRRKAKKTPLTTLCIDRCIITAEEAGELEKVVPDFRWDHHQVEVDNSDEDEDDECDDDYDYNGSDDDGNEYSDISESETSE